MPKTRSRKAYRDQQTGRRWADVISEEATSDGYAKIVRGINSTMNKHHLNNGAVIEGCAQVFAQIIVSGHREDAVEMRLAIISMIDDYAMKLALTWDD